jgi:hypothetical protein
MIKNLNHKRCAALRRVDELVASGEYISAAIYAKQHGISAKQARDLLGKPDKIINNNGTRIFLWKV